MTFFSLVISRGSKRGFSTMSPRISTARGRCSSRTFRWKEAYSGREGVHMAADGVDLGGDLLGRPVAGPLEDHVLDEVADTRLPGHLVAATALQPDPDRNAPDVGHGLGEKREAVREDFSRDHLRSFAQTPSVSQGSASDGSRRGGRD
jgi:hypothetical protein